MKIERLEALDKAAMPGPWSVDGTSKQVKVVHPVAHCDGCATNRSVVCRAMLNGPRHQKYARTNMELCAESRNALPALLAVAKAAKGLRATDSKGDWCPMTEQAMEDRERFTAELDAALAQLEATP